MMSLIPEGKVRLIFSQPLAPIQGDRFQPTGFADLGAAVYDAPGGRKLLVESAQSIANRLEAVCVKDSEGNPVDALSGLPYVAVELEGESSARTSSLIEAHRINSPFIISDKDFQAAFVTQAKYKQGKAVDWPSAARAVFHYCPNSLLHGVFMANLGDGRLRFARAVTGFIEASDVHEAVSGGVKNNPLDPSGEIRALGYDKDVYGNVPYSRVEFTAADIRAYFNIDLALLRSYALGTEAFELLVTLALYKIRKFLDTGLRLRTACDLALTGPTEGFTLPSLSDLEAALPKAIAASKGLFADPSTTIIKTKTVKKASTQK